MEDDHLERKDKCHKCCYMSAPPVASSEAEWEETNSPDIWRGVSRPNLGRVGGNVMGCQSSPSIQNTQIQTANERPVFRSRDWY